MFKGFDVKYPEYEVITPQTGYSYNLRSLSVQEEERLKGSFLTPGTLTEHLNKCLYDAITKKPEQITDYDTFLKKTTLKDRDALLYGLYHITYEDIRNYDIACAACKKSYAVSIKISTAFSINMYPDGDKILTKEIPVDLPIANTVTAFIKQPTLFDEMVTNKVIGSAVAGKTDVLTETLILSKFQYHPEDGDTVIYTDREDILDAYMSLSAKDKRKIFEIFRENFGQYGINLTMKTNCIHCRNVEDVDIDLVGNFFRMVYTVD